MPIEYRIEPERGLIRVVMRGVIGEDRFRAYQRRVLRDPAFSPSLARIYDLREVSTAPTTAQIRALVSTIVTRAFPTPAKRAIVVGSDVSYGMFRMLGSLLEGHTREQFCVFRSMEEAERWLESGPGSAPPLPPNGVG